LSSDTVLKSLLLYTTVGHCQILSGHMDNRCLAIALFVKDVSDFFEGLIGVACYPGHGRHLPSNQ